MACTYVWLMSLMGNGIKIFHLDLNCRKKSGIVSLQICDWTNWFCMINNIKRFMYSQSAPLSLIVFILYNQLLLLTSLSSDLEMKERLRVSRLKLWWIMAFIKLSNEHALCVPVNELEFFHLRWSNNWSRKCIASSATLCTFCRLLTSFACSAIPWTHIITLWYLNAPKQQKELYSRVPGKTQSVFTNLTT